jgi:hypothetical protein
MIAAVSRSSAAQRARSRDNSAAKNSARVNAAHAAAACCARLRRLYHVLRLMPSASQGRCAGRRGPMPCARRQRSERKRFFSRRSASVCFVADFRVKKSHRIRLTPPRWGRSPSRCKGNAPEPEKRKWLSRKSFSFKGPYSTGRPRSPSRCRSRQSSGRYRVKAPRKY